MKLLPLPSMALAALLAACVHRAPEAAQPLTVQGTAYEAALAVELPEQPALDHEDLHNVFHLSDQIISGGEPHSEQALERIAGWGVKTILSVDGKAPLVDAAERLGMRYVHVPIQYRGITDQELLEISKTFRELEGPFYVHCFHGKHRGPAAAAVGRLVLDGAPRDQAIAEMRQWMGTSPSYEGLYQCIASGAMPTAVETEAFDWNFTPQVDFEGMRGAMVFAARANDNLKALMAADWAVDPTHPDLVPDREAHRLMQIFERSLESEEVQQEGPEFRAMYASILEDARALEQALKDLARGESSSAAEADALTARIGKTCKACHREHRN